MSFCWKSTVAAAAFSTAIVLTPAAATTLTIAQNFDPQTLWPNGTTASDNLNAGSAIVESLFWQDPRTGKVEPLLATGYEMETPTTFILRLREDVGFTNGEPMDADAVVHSIAIFIDPEKTPAYARVAEPFAGAEKIDALTVRVTLKYPYPPLELALSQIHVVPPKLWTEMGLEAYGQAPVGTGPYKLTSWARDDKLVMERNPDYWGEAPVGIDEIVWRPVPDDAARFAGLVTGEFQIAKDLSVSVAPALEGQADVTLVPVPSYRIYQIGLSSLPKDQGPLQDKRVRQAVNYAIDKQAIIESLFFGKAEPLHGQVLRQPQLGFNPSVADYPHDPEKAKALLAEAGYPDGFSIPFKCPSGRYAQDREVCEAVAGMLSEAGIKAEMVALEPGEFLRQLRTMELAPMYFVGLAPQDDPSFQASQFLSDWRYSPIANPQMDALINAGAMEMDVEKRRKIYQDLMALMHDEAPIAFLYGGIDLYGTTARLKNFLPRGDGRMYFYGVTLDE
ncbi:ABC transporter substrate-binding protein [Nitratireductor soli]|uniref:ABC transporter substrate-binding protein n=1 Tax=Nitratireductor soli TaxID=1670619 RepID=UPI00065DE54B|nr:ABC transporter substrate-binding protein [Nitratireductor soli]